MQCGGEIQWLKRIVGSWPVKQVSNYIIRFFLILLKLTTTVIREGVFCGYATKIKFDQVVVGAETLFTNRCEVCGRMPDGLCITMGQSDWRFYPPKFAWFYTGLNPLCTQPSVNNLISRDFCTQPCR